MATARQESWDTGGLTFGQPSIGMSGAEVEDVWDDGAILKAFDDALSTHSRKPGAEARKWKKHAVQAAGGQASSRGASPYPVGTADGVQGFHQTESRFSSLLAKGDGEVAASRRAAGVPGPWEPVAREGEGSHRGVLPHEAGQRYDNGRTGSHDNFYSRGAEEYGAHHNPYLNGSQIPPGASNGAGAGFEEGWERHGLPPPPIPPMPHAGFGPHAAAHQSLDGVMDDDLADLLLAWYYSGYYTGRYCAMQEARTPRFRRRYPPPMGPIMPHGPPASTPNFGADAWERPGWQSQHPAAAAPGQSPASRSIGKRTGP